jgi:dipeptide/tripeptide permease
LYRYNIAISIVFAGLSLYVMSVGAELQPSGLAKFGPGYWPYYLGIALLLLSLGLLVETLGRRWLEKRRAAPGAAPAGDPQPIRFGSRGLICVYKLCGLLLVFVTLLYNVNFIAATFVFTPACMWLLGLRRKNLLVSVTLGLPSAVYFVFTYLLKIKLP